MVSFDLWSESFIFSFIYSVIVLVPCFFTVILGNRVLNQLGRYPSKAPLILLSIRVPFIFLIICTFSALLSFYSFFAD